MRELFPVVRREENKMTWIEWRWEPGAGSWAVGMGGSWSKYRASEVGGWNEVDRGG